MKLDESQISMVNAQIEWPNAQFVGSKYTHATHENYMKIIRELGIWKEPLRFTCVQK